MNEDLVTVATFVSLQEAHIAGGKLQARDINALIDDSRVSGIFGAFVLNPVIRLKVAPENVEQAREILEQSDDLDDDRDENQEP